MNLESQLQHDFTYCQDLLKKLKSSIDIENNKKILLSLIVDK
jgi:hypothetical protein